MLEKRRFLLLSLVYMKSVVYDTDGPPPVHHHRGTPCILFLTEYGTGHFTILLLLLLLLLSNILLSHILCVIVFCCRRMSHRPAGNGLLFRFDSRSFFFSFSLCLCCVRPKKKKKKEKTSGFYTSCVQTSTVKFKFRFSVCVPYTLISFLYR